jgi:DNA-directed RNA polymerase specialized sigma24 family protein
MQHFDSWLRFSAGGVGIDNVEPSRVDAEFVLEHQGYVARLARSLVFDAALADDLSQQI